jgi:hypothetical protein
VHVTFSFARRGDRDGGREAGAARTAVLFSVNTSHSRGCLRLPDEVQGSLVARLLAGGRERRRFRSLREDCVSSIFQKRREGVAGGAGGSAVRFGRRVDGGVGKRMDQREPRRRG